ncbi:MAG: type 4a pilus biogenesis protein PilO [Candidatus Omnitrophica bacterium]|nr:type 4a pilus biogenesis protein PilO [Candidatus Omnitrophota bacterium]
MRLEKDKLKMIIAGTSLICALGIYLFLYKPLVIDLKKAYRESRNWEIKVLDARGFIESVKITRAKSTVLAEEDISLAIDELTRFGRLKNVNYISMTPKEGRKKKHLHYQILPIEIETESTYEDLGEFLGSLDELEHSLITVDSFRITPHKAKEISDEGDLSNIKSKLVINMYLIGRVYAE